MMFKVHLLITIILILLCIGCENKEDEKFVITYSGGGILGGINPTSTEYIVYDDGSIVVNTYSLISGKDTDIRFVDKNDVQQVSDNMYEYGFLELNDTYDCIRISKCYFFKS